MAIITVIDYPVFMRLGCFESERIAGQFALVTLVLDLGPFAHDQGAPESDDISRTLDYGAVLAAVEGIVSNQEIHLIETAVFLLGRGLIERFAMIKSATVTIEKSRIPHGLAKGARILVTEQFGR